MKRSINSTAKGNAKRMNLQDLATACPNADFTVPYKPYNTSFSIGDFIIKRLSKTFDILKSSRLDNSCIVDFVRAEIQDHNLPFTKEFLLLNLRCTDVFASDFIEAQSSFIAVSFGPMEYKTLSLLDSVPFVVDRKTKVRRSGYGTVEKVFEGSNSFARLTISDDFGLDKINMELKTFELATKTGNRHLLKLQCAYQQDDRHCFVLSPWCDLDLGAFLRYPDNSTKWTSCNGNEKLVLITDLMCCLASGLSALHKNKIKHGDLKPENILLDANLMPIICDFGHCEIFAANSKSTNHCSASPYLPPEFEPGRKGDVFSLGLVFIEIALLMFGKKSLKYQCLSVPYCRGFDGRLNDFLVYNFGVSTKRADIFNNWLIHFQKLVPNMLEEIPRHRIRASQVWETLKVMIESLDANPHCEMVSEVASFESDDEDDFRIDYSI